jgi:hypothetical protein
MRCRITLSFIRLCAAVLLPTFAFAQITPMLMERTSIRIDAPTIRAADKMPKQNHPPLIYDTEVRSEDAMKLEYIHTLNTLTDSSAVMITFTAPTMVPLPVMKVYAPVDALFISDNGTVVQILPNVTLGEMTQEVMAHAPIKAFLFLKAGHVMARGIRPRDVVQGPMFTPAPPIME